MAAWCWLSKGRKFSLVKFMGQDWKPSCCSLANPHGKMIHPSRVGKSIFITFIQPTPHFYSLTERLLFPSWCWINQMSQESETLLQVVPSSADPAAPGKRGLFCPAWVGPVLRSSRTETARFSSLLLFQEFCLGSSCHSALLPFVCGAQRVIEWP